jgi:hypothetical protein
MAKMFFFCALFLSIIFPSCKKSPSNSMDESNRPEQNTINNKVSPDELKTPSKPIPLGACRIEVAWEESIPETANTLVEVSRFLGNGPSFSGYLPKEGDLLIISGLTEEAFEASKLLIIDVQSPLVIREDEIPLMSLIKIVE